MNVYYQKVRGTALILGLIPTQYADLIFEGIVWHKNMTKDLAESAFHNYLDPFDTSKCHPGTREVVLAEIMR